MDRRRNLHHATVAIPYPLRRPEYDLSDGEGGLNLTSQGFEVAHQLVIVTASLLRHVQILASSVL